MFEVFEPSHHRRLQDHHRQGRSLGAIGKLDIMMDLIDCLPELARLRLEALYVHDQRARLVSVNEWNGGTAPRFHLMRTATATISRFRADLPDELVVQLEALCAQEPVNRRQDESPAQEIKFLELLSSHAPVSRI